MVDAASYAPLPEDWFIGVADVKGSTAEVEAGRYKVVNTVGAAVISAQINGANGAPFPFVFGGDGAAFAFWPEHENAVRMSLSAVRRWALEEFGIQLRGAIVPVAEIRKAGVDVAVARYQASSGVDYAMFEGGGVSWAERQMKQGNFCVEMAPVGTFPDLTGLSCRWTPIRPENGVILSVLVLPVASAPAEKIAEMMRSIVTLTGKLQRGGHPVPVDGPSTSWPPAGLDLEVHASHGASSFMKRKIRLLADTFFAWVLFKTGKKAGRFDPVHYAKTLSQNADFKKFEDGLKMTLDCDPTTQAELEILLKSAADKGLITFGLFAQDEALMTCIVPSPLADNHLHFIDGAAGGYTKAATKMKSGVKNVIQTGAG